jgi:hypothetical protein
MSIRELIFDKSIIAEPLRNGGMGPSKNTDFLPEDSELIL